MPMTKAKEMAESKEDEAIECLGHIEAVDISSSEDLRFAVSVVAEVKTKHKEVETERKGFIEDAQAIISRTNRFFKPALESLAKCEKVLKGKISAYASDNTHHADVPGLSIRANILLDVQDPVAALSWCIANDRLDLLQLNVPAVKSLAKCSVFSLEIPGVVISRSSTVVITTGKVVHA